MANDCLFWLRVVSPKKKAISDLEKIMQYKDEKRYMYRVRELQKTKQWKQNDLYVAEFEGDVAWSDHYWFHPYDMSRFEGNKQPPPKTFQELCPELDIGVESWTEELGIGFQGHVACDRHGKILVDEERNYAVTSGGKPRRDVPGFGKSFRDCFEPEFLYRGLESVVEKP